jgi:hypothetical protein
MPSESNSASSEKLLAGERLRRNFEDMWEHWGLDTVLYLRGKGIDDPDLLTAIAQGDLPPGSQIGQLFMASYEQAQLMRDSLKLKIAQINVASKDADDLLALVEAFGVAKEIAGRRAAQLELYSADQWDLSTTSDRSQREKKARMNARLRVVEDFIVDRRLRNRSATALAQGYLVDINGALIQAGQKDWSNWEVFRRQLVPMLRAWRVAVLKPFLVEANLVIASAPDILLSHKDRLKGCITRAGLYCPIDAEFVKDLQQALDELRSEEKR